MNFRPKSIVRPDRGAGPRRSSPKCRAAQDKQVVVGLLRGSVSWFIADAGAARLDDVDIEVDLRRGRVLRDSTGANGSREVRRSLKGSLRGEIERTANDHGGGEYVDTGHTLARVTEYLRTRDPAKLRTIALLDKPARREVDFKADFTGFEIPDEFVVGYGIDYAQANRNLPYIGKVRFTDG